MWLKSCVLVEAEHEIHVLHGRAGGTLAEVVEQGGDGRLVLVAADDQAELVRADQGVGVDDGLIPAEGSHGDEGLALIIGVQDVVDVICRGSAGQGVVAEHDGGGHALDVIA